jgi:hypothetical protein
MRHFLAGLLLTWSVTASDGTFYPPTGAYWPVQATVYFVTVNDYLPDADGNGLHPVYGSWAPARYWIWSRPGCAPASNACLDLPGNPGPGEVWAWELLAVLHE